MMGRNVRVVSLLVLVAILCDPSFGGDEYYTNEWAVHIEGGEHVARRLAETHGFTYVDMVLLLLLLLLIWLD